MLEINFPDEHEREALAEFARTRVYDFAEIDLSECESDSQDHSPFRDSNEDIEREAESKKQVDSSIERVDDEEELEHSMVCPPEKRFNIYLLLVHTIVLKVSESHKYFATVQ